MTCPTCNSPLAADAKFCPVCGTRMTPPPQYPPAQYPPPRPEPPPQPYGYPQQPQQPQYPHPGYGSTPAYGQPPQTLPAPPAYPPQPPYGGPPQPPYGGPPQGPYGGGPVGYPQQPQAQPGVSPIRFYGDGSTLFGIWIVNVLLSLVTLGIYSFWGKTKVRKYLWGQTEFMGERFVYHGTGMELFIGALKVIGIIILILALLVVLQLAAGPRARAVVLIIASLVEIVGIILILPMAIVGSWRYRLSRTSWRGIRFSYRGTISQFAWMFYKGAFLTIITIGFYSPWFLTEMHSTITKNIHYGSEKFDFDGNGGDLFLPWFVSGLLSFFTLGLSQIWFLGHRSQYYFSRTTLGPTRLMCSLDPMGYVGMMFVNGLLTFITLGFYTPWATIKREQFVLSSLALYGHLDLARIQQETIAMGTATGDALAGVFDVDTGFGG